MKLPHTTTIPFAQDITLHMHDTQQAYIPCELSP